MNSTSRAALTKTRIQFTVALFAPLAALAALAALAVGCGSETAAPSSSTELSQPDRVLAELRATANPPKGSINEGKEFRHNPNVSKFRLGTGGKSLNDASYDKIVGSNGVFAMHRVTGAALAVPNADAPALKVPALSNIARVHNERVLKYFLGAGIPKEEIGGMHVTTTMAGGAPKVQAGTAFKNTRFIAYTTHLERYIDGIPIVDSQAWASFNANDEVMSEGVYWPAIPADVIAKASLIRSIIQDPNQHANLRAEIKKRSARVRDEPGRVVITHTHSAYDGAPLSRAAYEVIPAGPGSLVLHFDELGQPLPALHSVPSQQDSPKQ